MKAGKLFNKKHSEGLDKIWTIYVLFIPLVFPGFLFAGNLLSIVLCSKRSTISQQVLHKCVQPSHERKFAGLESTAQLELHCISMYRCKGIWEVPIQLHKKNILESLFLCSR